MKVDSNKLSTILYSNKLDVKKFENLLSNNDQGYKFFWLEAILKLIAQNRQLFTFEDVIDEMIVGAWRMVTYYHLRLGHTVNGNAENFLEHAIRILYECSKKEIGNKTPSKDRLMFLIKKYQDNLMEDKLHLTDYVPYRLIKPFVEKEGKEYIDRKTYGRFIAYLNAFTKANHEFFYDIVDAKNPLMRKIRLNEEWVNFIIQNYAVIMGWLRFNKALFIQDRNPGVPGVMYKVAPETEEKRKSLKNARELWIATVDVTGRPLYEIYTGNELSIDEFDLDHFVPRSYVSNDELWNLTPMAKNLNSSKNNKLPDRRYIKDFVKYNYYLYSLIFANDSKDQAAILKHYFDRCENQHLNAVWATEKLYIPGNTEEQFRNILEENLSLVYDSAKLQEYEEWVI
ncbi:HNH endonuclease domain-containing protein [Eubacterium callanderi]|uniref:HNH nuclease domain-containing protein n=1 Tax=Eubacterium limosum TaxID=1736 RepID=A0A6N3G3I2_EUBLI|nr:HNH endonuclease domain-containing protein [Eubacterium callanderi]